MPARGLTVDVRDVLDAIPMCLMLCDSELTITHINLASREALVRLADWLPVPIDRLVGVRLDSLCSVPLGGGPDRREFMLPWWSRTQLGSRTVELNISAVPSDGDDHAVLVRWDDVTDRLALEEKLAAITALLSDHTTIKERSLSDELRAGR